MFIYLSKILPPLLFPPGLSLWLLLLGIWLARGRRARLVLAAALLLLVAPATPLCSDALMRSLEDRYPLKAAAASPAADAIVVLGGGTTGRTPEQPEPQISASGGRLLHALRLYKAGRAPLLLLSGDGLSPGDSEASQMRQILSEWGVPDGAMLLEERSRNTHENAVEVVALARARGLRRLLLVTSAYHIRRAEALFRHEAAGALEIIPAPTGRFSAYRRPFWLLNVIPEAGAMGVTVLALREHLGLLVYKAKGWL